MAREAEPIAAEGTREPEPRARWTRRGFLSRTSIAAFGAFAVVAGAPDAAKAARRPQPPPCRVNCEPISKTGCGCGGHLYRCSGCHSQFHACIDGQPFAWVCLRRRC
ncbi:MAG: hypothetical protein QOE25_515 [Actinomycetota bacterium]|nr:hypothetical protein [Actinomycetota bacterium]